MSLLARPRRCLWLTGRYKGWGRFYPLQTHPSQGYAFSPFTAAKFSSVDSQTPFVKVYFACISLVDSHAAASAHVHKAFRYATKSKQRSIFVLAPSLTTGGLLGGSQLETATVRYVVPSEQLATATLTRRFESSQRKKTPRGSPRLLRLRNGELVDVYAVPVEKVPVVLLKAFRQADGSGTVFFGDEQLDCGCKIQIDRYLEDQRSILQGYVDLLQLQAQRMDAGLPESKRIQRRQPPRTCTRCRVLRVPCSL